HAELDEIRAGLRQCRENLLAGLRIGIARHHEGHQRRTALAGAEREALGNAGTHYISIPRYLPTDSTSLSPRPDRQRTMLWSLPMVGATLLSSASPCALSSAGMIPSSRVQSWNASSASLSVIGA